MNLIRIYALITLVIAISFSILSYAEAKKMQSEELFSRKGHILPSDQWMQQLVGEWDINLTLRNPHEIIDVVGKVNFYQDSTFREDLKFTRYDWIKPYKVKRLIKYLSDTGKATRKGKLYFDRENGQLTILKYVPYGENICEEKKTYNRTDNIGKHVFGICDRVESSLKLFGAGDFGSFYKLLAFEKNRIAIEMEDDAFDEPVIISYRKVKK